MSFVDHANIHRQVQLAILPLLPQLTNEPRSNLCRNVALISKNWFDIFANWIKDLNQPYPTAIDNKELHNTLTRNEPASEGVDFEIVELNVYDALFSIFGGGPVIRRPFMTNPTTRVGNAVVYPIKVNIVVDGVTKQRTIDPAWTVYDLKKFLAEKMKFDSFHCTLRPQNQNSTPDDQMNMKDVVEQFGINLCIDLPLSGSTSISDFSSTANKASSSASIGLTDASYGSQTSTNTRQTGISAIFLSLMNSIARNSLIQEKFANEEIVNHVFPEGSSAKIWISYIQDISRSFHSTIPAKNIFSLIAEERPELTSMRSLNIEDTFQTFLHVIDNDMPENFRIDSIFSSKIHIESRCSKCGSSFSEEVSSCVFDLEIPQKWFRKASLSDAIDNYLTNRTNDAFSCPKCKKTTSARMLTTILSLPPVLIFSLQRDSRDNVAGKKRAELTYSATLDLFKYLPNSSSSKYKLVGIVSLSGQIVHQKYKSYVFDYRTKEWLFFNESRARITDPNSVIMPDSALLLVYQLNDITL